MARPGFVLEVGERTPPLLVTQGDRFRLERLPLGTRVLYPADGLPRVPDLREALTQALTAPLASDPLPARLRPGMKLTLVFDDISVPVPPMRQPDLRARILEAVLSHAAAAGVDDVALVARTGLGRRMTEAELLRVTGERVFRSFFADGLLRNHDAEDADQLAGVGSTETGEVRVNARVAASDLVVQVRLVTAPRSGAEDLAAGLGGTGTIQQVAGLAARRSDGQTATVAGALAAAVPVFQIDAVLDNDAYAGPVEFLGRREWEWSIRERAAWQVLQRGLPYTPPKARRRLLDSTEAGYHATAVFAGDPAAVDAASAERVRAQQVVDIEGRSDVGIVGVGHATAHSVGAPTNPVLAAWAALAAAYGSHTGTPVVRDGGALIVYHPLRPDFSPLHHPAYVDFFAEVLSVTTDPEKIQAEFEDRFATDPWYVHLYRTSLACHGLHPFHRWYELAAARDRCADVVWVGADRRTVERLGFRAASTLADALEIVASTVGRTPSITYLHDPAHVIANVT